MQAFARWGLWLIQVLRESNDSLRSSAKVVTGDPKTFCSRESEKSTWAGLSNLGSLQTLLQQPRWDFYRSICSDSWQKVSSVLQPSTIHNKFFYRSKPIFRNVSSLPCLSLFKLLTLITHLKDSGAFSSRFKVHLFSWFIFLANLGKSKANRKYNVYFV